MSASEPIPSPEDAAPPRPAAPEAPRGGDPVANTDERPDWLVGAEEGAAAEHQRADAVTPVKLQRPALLPVEGLEQGREAMRPADTEGPGLTLPANSAPIEGFERGEDFASPDSGASAGIPLPKPVAGARPASADPRPDSGIMAGLPLASRRAGGSAPAEAAKSQAWAAKGSSVPKLAVVSAAPRAAEPMEETDDFNVAGHAAAEPGATLIGAAEASPMRPTLRPLEEPWWMILGERLATERRLQVLIGSLVVVIVAAFVFWPHEGRSASVRNIKKHPEVYEGQTVRVHGQVEEVFPIGNGWVYDLRQGRDTITVFTRGAMPERHQGVNVVGQVSTGYLDGRPRIAILENGGS
jgi:hypothetical protein